MQHARALQLPVLCPHHQRGRADALLQAFIPAGRLRVDDGGAALCSGFKHRLQTRHEPLPRRGAVPHARGERPRLN